MQGFRIGESDNYTAINEEEIANSPRTPYPEDWKEPSRN
jgi:hypothetical protein